VVVVHAVQPRPGLERPADAGAHLARLDTRIQSGEDEIAARVVTVEDALS